MTKHTRPQDAEGSAALSICESLLLALTDAQVISERAARDLLTDVVTAHEEAAEASTAPDRHRAIAAIVRRILSGEDGVRDLAQIRDR